MKKVINLGHGLIQWPSDSTLYISRGHRLEFLNQDVLQSLKIVFILANSTDPDERPHYVAFHLGHHCLTKYLFSGFQYTRVYHLASI